MKKYNLAEEVIQIMVGKLVYRAVSTCLECEFKNDVNKCSSFKGEENCEILRKALDEEMK